MPFFLLILFIFGFSFKNVLESEEGNCTNKKYVKTVDLGYWNLKMGNYTNKGNSTYRGNSTYKETHKQGKLYRQGKIHIQGKLYRQGKIL
jgi:hypothetical protein